MHTADVSRGTAKNGKAVMWVLTAAKGHTTSTGTITVTIIAKIRDTPHIAARIPITVFVVMMLL